MENYFNYILTYIYLNKIKIVLVMHVKNTINK